MTAQIKFFCSQREEELLLNFLTSKPAAAVFMMDGQRFLEARDFAPSHLPPWPNFICLYLWVESHGPLQWHTDRPQLEGATHRAFVTRFFERQQWDQLGAVEGDMMLDQERSPGICYKRPEFLDGRFGPCTLIAPPSSLDRIGNEYSKMGESLHWLDTSPR